MINLKGLKKDLHKYKNGDQILIEEQLDSVNADFEGTIPENFTVSKTVYRIRIQEYSYPVRLGADLAWQKANDRFLKDQEDDQICLNYNCSIYRPEQIALSNQIVWKFISIVPV